jgi:tRNA threonylcarbamoyladenosine biosynthesis protein TsaE
MQLDKVGNNGLLAVSVDIQALEQIGRCIGKCCQAGTTLMLYGNLGAGKTTLARFVAYGLGVAVETYITSPSFNLLHEYDGRLPLYHIDCYRLTGEEDIEGAGLVEYISAHGVSLIEWPDRLGSLMPQDYIAIRIDIVDNNHRRVAITWHGQEAAEQRDHFIELMR